MNPITANYLGSLTAALTVQLLNAAGNLSRRALSAPEKKKALERAVQAGLVALLADVTAATKDEKNVLADIFKTFFSNDDVGRELALLLRGAPPDMQELAFLFKEAGYVAETLPGLDFERGITAFEAAFLSAAADDPALQESLKTGNLLEQTRLQRQILTQIRQLVDFLRNAAPNSVGIKAGTITAANVVNGKQIIYRMAPPKTILAPSDWEKHYLRALLAECGHLDLSPIDETRLQSSAAAGGQSAVRTSDVFTTLYLKEISRSPKQSAADAARAWFNRNRPDAALDDAAGNPRNETMRAAHLPVSAVEAVSAAKRLVILGEPGGGKSTLLNYLASQLARLRLGDLSAGEAPLSGWPAEARPLPVRIVLRKFAAWLPAGTRGEAGDVWNYLQHQLERWGYVEAFPQLKALLLRGQGIIFFDGLDEVSQTDAEGRRSRIVRAVRQFAGHLQRCRVIVTSRTYAYKQGDAWRLPDKRFPVVTLDYFQPEQIEAFTRTWYQVVGPQKGWDADKCRAEAEHLYRATQDLPHLQELARYPLLLTLMAHLHGVDGTLPHDRADLYRRAVDLLLSRWDNRIVRDAGAGQEKQIPGLVMRLGLRAVQLRQALQRVALTAMERQEKQRTEEAGNIPRAELLNELEAELNSLDKAKIVIEYVQNRAGLLQERGEKVYAFPHRTFQEYLAAKHLLLDADPVIALTARVRRDVDWWREIFALAAAENRENPSMIASLVDELLPEETTAGLPAIELTQLMGQVLVETEFARHTAKTARFRKMYNRVVYWHRRALGAETALPASARVETGAILARLGDPRLTVTGVYKLPSPSGEDDKILLPRLDLVNVPAGSFLLGANEGEDAFGDEKPQHKLTLPQFNITRYPITNAQYALFIKAKGYNDKRWWSAAGWAWRNGQEPEPDLSYYDEETQKSVANWLAGRPAARRGEPFFWQDERYNRANQPVVGISWYEAMAYCAWLNGQLNNKKWQVRLPTEAEWEKAAGWDSKRRRKRVYPWGDRWDKNKANIEESGIGAPSAVGIFPSGASPCGAMDMSGNVWEWTLSSWGSFNWRAPGFSYPFETALPQMQPGERDAEDAPGFRVMRGGSWIIGQRNARVSVRSLSLPDDFDDSIGFRLVLAPALKLQ